MRRIYLDNGSTSFPKAPKTGAAMAGFIENIGVNVGRGGYEEAYSAAEVVIETRERLCGLFNCDKPENVIFTSGVTASLNMLLKGFLVPGDSVVTTSMEHNAVMRPLTQLAETGVHVQVVGCESDGSLPLQKLHEAIMTRPKALVMTHASNVCGTLMPIKEAADICHSYGTALIVDCAQTGGVFPIDMLNYGIDALAFSGHKGLLGPQGIGGFIITSELSDRIAPVFSGGTGSQSHLLTMPSFMPDRFEAGTQNLPGIFGLHSALSYIEEIGIDAIREASMKQAARLLEGLLSTDGIKVIGKRDMSDRCAVISVSFLNRDNAEAAFMLEERYGIMSRCGLHCAPLAHKTLLTYPSGTVRFSPGHTTTEEEIELAVAAVREAAKR